MADREMQKKTKKLPARQAIEVLQQDAKSLLQEKKGREDSLNDILSIKEKLLNRLQHVRGLLQAHQKGRLTSVYSFPRAG